MEELNRDDIKKALECCKTPLASDCANCSYTGKRLEDGVYEGCVNRLVGDALALIKSLAATNESLEAAIGALKEEIKMARADAVKSFAERLKRYYDENEKYLGYSIAYNIDQTAKEMEEGVCDT